MHAPMPVNLLPGVPLIDSPFFDRLFPLSNPDAQTRRIAEDLREKGFAVFDFPDPEIDRLCEEIKARHAPGPDKLAAWRAGTLDLRNQDAWRTDPNVKRRRAQRHGAVASSRRPMAGRHFAFQTLNFAVGSQQPPHSDSTHFSASPEGFMCGVWLALEDIDADNGPLIYYPGSHRWPHYFNEHIGVNAWHQPTRGAHAGQYQKAVGRADRDAPGQAGALHRQEGPGDHLACAPDAWRRQAERSGALALQPGDALLFHATAAYYTPMYSDPFYGNIFFREMTDIATGEAIPNMVSGYKVP